MKHKFFTAFLWLLPCWVSSTIVLSFHSKPVTGQAEQAASPLASPTTARSVLPDAIYFLTERGQIARLEADGQTLTTITWEAEPVVEIGSLKRSHQ